jgi:predicted flap endonuclease-1-like 5' DNA nuclease
MATISEIEGIGPVFAEKLRTAGVRSTGALLAKGGSAKGRKELASATGIDEARILEWVNHADLLRLRGVGGEYADLLEAAGVDTVPELALRNPAALYKTLVTTNEAQHLVRKLPTADQVKAWAKQAKSLRRAVEY